MICNLVGDVLLGLLTEAALMQEPQRKRICVESGKPVTTLCHSLEIRGILSTYHTQSGADSVRLYL
jgi:hypothetical protein